MRSKNIVTLTLMISSLIFLIILQALWLRSSYESAFHDFRRDANILFHSAVISVRDSLLAKNIEVISTDSMHEGTSEFFALRNDSIRTRISSYDTVSRRNRYHTQTSQIQIFVRNGDSLNADVLRPIVAKIQDEDGKSRKGATTSLIVKLMPDTLNRDSLRLQVNKVMVTAGITTPFVIQHIKDGGEASFELPGLPPPIRFKHIMADNPSFNHATFFYSDTLKTEPVKLNPIHAYAAFFVGIRSSLVKKITPQILFSLFLTLMITGAFVLMYRNIRAQQKLMELKNDFISNVTHELKTPVATVSVALEALKNFSALNNQKLTEEYLEIAQRELNRLTAMTEKILKVSVFESSGVAFTPEKINFYDLIKQVVDSNRALLEKRNADVRVTHEGTDFQITGSVMHLTSVIHNLLDNAMKYSSERPVIQIHIADTGQKLVFTIKDHGMGIPNEYQKKIFEKFFRVPSGDIHNIKGYGLGLSHVASIVKSHHGKIGVTSEPGIGSEFKITFRKAATEFKAT